MNNDASQIFAVILVLLIFFGFLLFFILFFGYIGYQNWKRKEKRARILRDNPQLAASYPNFPVRHASEPRFRAFFKILPWESAGLIFMTPAGLIYMGETMSGTPITFQFRPEQVRWLGKQAWPNGAVSWFEVQEGMSKHYFTSETGFFVFGSDRTTREIQQQISQPQAPMMNPH